MASQTETEKITINLSPVDLGKIDVLVEQGHYSNRTDLIRTAIRSQLEKHTFEIQQVVIKDSFVIGVLAYGRGHLERMRAKGEKLNVTVIGALRFARDIPPPLAAEVIESIRVRGIFHATADVKAALADRTR